MRQWKHTERVCVKGGFIFSYNIITSTVRDMDYRFNQETFDVPGIHLHAEIPKEERVFIEFEGEFVDIMST